MGFVGRRRWEEWKAIGGWGGREEIGTAVEWVSTSGGQCFDDHWSLGSVLRENTHRAWAVFAWKHTPLCLESDLITIRVISSASTLMSKQRCPRLMGAT